MNVIYYYYFLFYKNILKDNEPHLLTTLALSASMSFIITGIIDVIIMVGYCQFAKTWELFLVFCFVIGLNYIGYHRTGKAKEIVENKPQFFNSHTLSIIIVLAFFLITVSTLFWKVDLMLIYMENNCK